MAYRSKFIFLTLLCFLVSNPCYSETNTLHQGQQLKDWDQLISSNMVFCLKFFSFGTMVSPYLGVFYNTEQIRYPNSDYYQKRASDDFCNSAAVWVANRNHPIPDIYGKLIIDVHGKFSILSSGGTVLDLFNPTPLATRNASVTLLDSGNLVLRELHPDGSVKRVLWQSFDYPTDTLLPGMKLGINLKTGHKWSLTSWRNDELPSEGLFTLELNETGQMVILREGNVHWVSGPWQNGEFNNTDLQSSGPDVRLHNVSNESEQSFTYLTRTYDSYPVLKIHQDGQLMGSPLKLNIHCRFINDPPGCAEDEFEKLECRKNYYIESRGSNWGYPYYSYEDEHLYDKSYNLYDCRRICWSSCSCVAFTTIRNRVGCKTYGKKVPGVYNETAAKYYTINHHEDMAKEKKSKAWIGLIIMIVPLAVLLACYWAYKNIDFKEIGKKIKKVSLLQMRRMRRFYIYLRTDKNVNAELRYFTFQSISSATNSFSSTNLLGKGGFGEVYKLIF